MADNDTLPATGSVVATDDIGGIKFQRIKLIHGVDGTNDGGDVARTNGLPIGGSQSALTSVAWTSATALNTASAISVLGMNTVTVALANTSTMTAGVLTFEVSPDNTNWFPIAMARIDSYTVETTYTLNIVANRAWSTSVDGFTNFRVRLSTQITGTGTANVFITAQAMPIEPVVTAGQSDPTLLNMTPAQRQLWFELDVPGYNTVAYTAGDQLGTLISITNAARVTGGTGWINSILYHDDDNVMGAIDVLFFNDTLTLAANNAAFAISDADARKLLYLAQLSNVTALGAQRFIQANGLSIPYFCTGTTLFVALIQRTAPTLTGTTTQRIRFGLTRD